MLFYLLYNFKPFFPLSVTYRFIHGGQFLNGLAGPTLMSAGPYLSTTWFAPDQRATATAVASLFSYLGGAASFVVGPLVVPAPNDTQAVTTVAATVSDSSIRDRIQLVMYAGTDSKQEPLRAWRIDSTSFWHHVRGTRGQKHNQATGSKKFSQTPESSNYNVHNHPFEKLIPGTVMLNWFRKLKTRWKEKQACWNGLRLQLLFNLR